MKHTICITTALLLLLIAGAAHAQDAETPKKKKSHEVSISNRGIFFKTIDSARKAADTQPKKEKSFTSTMMLDLGLINMQDNTDYTSASVRSYLNVPAAQQNKSLFDLKTKSVYANYYPWLESFKALKTHGQKIYITSGIGFQFYNLRYENNITYTRNPSTIIMDTLKFSKNKIGLDYLNVPLMLTFKTRLNANPDHPHREKWLVYGVGVTEGYRIASWSKQISGELGKVKLHSPFNFADFNTCVSAEIGLEDYVRFFASYQVTSLYNNGIDQHPVAIGLRISGI